jgi:hypothetical protein
LSLSGMRLVSMRRTFTTPKVFYSLRIEQVLGSLESHQVPVVPE